MPRRHFPKNLIFLMIFSLISMQVYPLGFALADEPASETTDSSADKSSADKKVEEKTNSEITATDKSDEKKKTETKDDKPKNDSQKIVDPSVADETTADEKTDTKSNTEIEGVPSSDEKTVDEKAVSATDLPLTTDSPTEAETTPPTDQLVAVSESVTTPEVAPDSNPTEISILNTNDSTAENVVDTATDTGGNVTGVDTSPQTSPPVEVEVPPVPTSDVTNTEATVAQPSDVEPLVAEQVAPEERTGETADVVAAPEIIPTPPAEVAISTGDANSVTVVKNDINTNVTTENGTVSNVDIYDYTGDINLLQAFNEVLVKAKAAADSNTGAISLAIQNINSAVVDNRASTTSSTGENFAAGNGASIVTGDASAVTDIVNYINTNIVGNNWLYATLNIFGNWNGNLIVPGEGLLNVSAPRNFLSVNILNENSAAVDNSVSTMADTGGNLAEGGLASGASIQTGNATAGTNVANILNTNIVKNNWFMLLFNNMGNWTGQILNWGADGGSAFAYDLGSFTLPGEPAGTLSVINQNSAQVSNSVVTTAATGNNSATGNAGGTSVTTGNASAFSNIFNMINTNIIGDNWFFGVVNNMGNWQGNVEFAYPDLAVALITDKAAVSPGEPVDFTVHYKNLGSADSGAAKLSVDLPSDLRAEKTTWNIAGLKPGEEGSVELRAEVKSDASAGEILKSTANISTETKEVNLDNNSDSDETGVYDANFAASSSEDDLNSKLIVKRSSTVTDQAKPGDHVKNTIIVENKSDNSLYNVSVSDKMLIADGTKLADFAWPIGKIKKGSKVMIQYEFIVNNPGQVVAVNYVAKAIGQDLTGKDVASHKASDWLTVLGFVSSAYAASDQETPTVAGVETRSDTPAGSVLQDAPATPLGWPLWLWLVSVSAYLLDALRNRLTLNKRLTG